MKVFVAAPLRGRDLVETRENRERVKPIAGGLLRNGHLPLVPHYFAERHVLDPFSVDEDAIGRAAGLQLLELADEVHFHFQGDLSHGMRAEEAHAHLIHERRERERVRVSAWFDAVERDLAALEGGAAATMLPLIRKWANRQLKPKPLLRYLEDGR